MPRFINALPALSADLRNVLDQNLLNQLLQPMAELLREGQACGIPTETVYGLAADALSESATSKIFEAKGRPRDNPLIVHIYSLTQLKTLVNEELFQNGHPMNRHYIKYLEPLLNKYWPGPLTVLLPKKLINGPPDAVTAGLPTVAIRWPSHPVAQRLIELSGCPLAAPSANLSGRPSPTTAAHVLMDLGTRIEGIVDGGACEIGVESTVVDVWSGDSWITDPENSAMLLRPGGITMKSLREFLPNIKIHPNVLASVKPKEENYTAEGDDEFKPSTPGMKYRHYAPNTPLHLLVPDSEMSEEQLSHAVDKYIQQIKVESPDTKVVRILPQKSAEYDTKIYLHGVIELSENGSIEEVAKNLFAVLRSADEMGGDIIVGQVPMNELEDSLAVMNRICKAASRLIPTHKLSA